MTLTQAALRATLDYDETTGVFRRRGGPNIGAVAGSVNTNGHIVVWVDGRRYGAHRLVWLYVHGRWPAEEIDHIDLDASNNRLSNLREATRSLNCANKRQLSSKSGLRGVSIRERGGKVAYRAHIKIAGRTRQLGTFPTAEAAHAAYRKAADEAFGSFAYYNGPGDRHA